VFPRTYVRDRFIVRNFKQGTELVFRTILQWRNFLWKRELENFS
jgi:hypothetical protein